MLLHGYDRRHMGMLSPKKLEHLPGGVYSRYISSNWSDAADPWHGRDRKLRLELITAWNKGWGIRVGIPP